MKGKNRIKMFHYFFVALVNNHYLPGKVTFVFIFVLAPRRSSIKTKFSLILPPRRPTGRGRKRDDEIFSASNGASPSDVLVLRNHVDPTHFFQLLIDLTTVSTSSTYFM